MKFKMERVEKRVIKSDEKIEFRAGESGEAEGVVSGYGIVYNKPTEIFPNFREVIKPGAFTDSLKEDREVKSFFNHSADMVLSTTRSEPQLKLEENARGVKFESPIPPTSYGKDLQINLERGNIRGSSFSFTINEGGDTWTEDRKGVLTREITSATLYEIGPVTNPAYEKSSASLRSLESAVEEWRQEHKEDSNIEQEKETAAIEQQRAENDLALKIKNVQALEKL